MSSAIYSEGNWCGNLPRRKCVKGDGHVEENKLYMNKLSKGSQFLHSMKGISSLSFLFF